MFLYIVAENMEDLIHHILHSVSENKANAPSNPFLHILRELDSALQEEVEKEHKATAPQQKGKGIPTDVYKEGALIHVYMDIPGVSKSDIDIHISQENVLCVSLEKRAPVLENNEECILKERSFGIFRKNVQLPKTIDRTSLQAKYEQGVLHISCSQKSRDDTMYRVNID